MNSEFRRTNVVIGFLLFLFWKKRYLEQAVNHGMAINLEAPDLMAAFEAGTFPKSDWKEESLSTALEQYKRLSKSFYGSFIKTIVLALILLIVAWFVGGIGLDIALSFSEVVILAGTFFAVWGGLVQFSPVEQTFCKETLHENVHAFIALLLFFPGAAVAFLGVFH